MKLEISINEPFIYVKGIYTVNGIDVTRKGLAFTFINNQPYLFGNNWDTYSVGTEDVKLSQTVAIGIAKEYAYGYSWGVGDVVVSDFIILDSPVDAEFHMEPREDNALYPCWNIQLHLDKTYLGNVVGIQVWLWDDTKEVAHISAIAVGTDFPYESITPSTENPKQKLSTETVLFCTAFATIVAIIAISVITVRDCYSRLV
ncbi:MAG: hypothetical protein LBC12_06195 [Nitrososphaerota archaeon]|nr:hypothetical protein [Nitrososphaerota archaeon]